MEHFTWVGFPPVYRIFRWAHKGIFIIKVYIASC